MLTPAQVLEIQQALQQAQHPVIFFHDDPDGLSSYLLLHKLAKNPVGIPVKARPVMTELHSRMANNHEPDAVFVVDIALMQQVFADNVRVPIIWIDHHEPQEVVGVKYYNPHLNGESVPAAVLCYQIAQQDMWVAMVGALGDWHMPFFAKEFEEKYPDLLTTGRESIPKALFESKIGMLARVFSFNLMGDTQLVQKSVQSMTTIKSPQEILEQTTEAGQFVWARYERVKKAYDALKKKALEHKPSNGLYVFTYETEEYSLTKDLANELLYTYSDSVILLGRKKAGDVRCSMRSPAHISSAKILEKGLQGLQGHGGGHENAVGLSVKQDDWELFLRQVEEELAKQKNA